LKLKPDYVILDVMMPGELNGFQICSMVKSWPDTQSCKIKLLTALTEQRDLENGQEAGADFYVTKPFSPKNLLSLIETAELSKTQGPP
jgi:CheY-like chemotaxis protein